AVAGPGPRHLFPRASAPRPLAQRCPRQSTVADQNACDRPALPRSPNCSPAFAARVKDCPALRSSLLMAPFLIVLLHFVLTPAHALGFFPCHHDGTNSSTSQRVR